LKDTSSHTWYLGHIVDVISDDKLMIGFEDDVWPRKEFPVARVRKPPNRNDADLEAFNPAVGDEVELRVNATEHAPASWSAAVVRKIQHSFYFVARVSSIAAMDSSGSGDIVEKEMLRPSSANHSGLNASSLQKEMFKLPPSLHSWALTSDAAGCFSHIEEQSGLIQIGPLQGELRLVGDKASLKRAHLALEVHIRHQTQIQNFQDKREKRLKALEEKRNRIEGSGFKSSVEFGIDPSFVARVIGSKGNAIRAVEEKYGVQVNIRGQESDGEQVIRIFGNCVEDIEKARAEVEYVEEAVPIDDPDMHKWVRGGGGRTLNRFRDSAGLVYAKLDRESNKLYLCGTRQAVDDAVAMFETHMMYFPVFQQMEDAMQGVISQLEEYGDRDARWEWESWWREELDEGPAYQKSKGKGKTSKGAGKAEKAKGSKVNGKGGKAWEEEKGGKRGGKSSRYWDSQHNNHYEQEWQEEEEEEENKSSYNAREKAPVRTGRQWKAVSDERKAEEPEGEVASESDAATGGGKASGRGRTRGGGATGRERGTGIASTEPQQEQAGHAEDDGCEERPERPAPGTRRMGKKGVRS